MTSEWEDSTLGDVLTLQRGMDLPVQERKGVSIQLLLQLELLAFTMKHQLKLPEL